MSELWPGIVLTLATSWLIIGVLWRTIGWIRTPSPYPIPIMPAPQTRTGVVGRLLLETVLFRSLARASRTTWVASLVFHYALLWTLIVHLRLLITPLPLWLLPFLQFSGFAALALLTGLGVLLLRRCVVDRLRYISTPSDYLMLLLLMAITLSGFWIKRYAPVDLYAVGEFVRGAMQLDWQPLPRHSGLYGHLILVLVLMCLFPISKLMHGVGVLISPSFNQVDRRPDQPGKQGDE